MNVILIFFLIATSVIAAYTVVHVYLPTKGTTYSATASFGINFAYIYVIQRENNFTFLSLLVTNSGSSTFNITSVEVGNVTVNLPTNNMNGTAKCAFASQAYLQFPLPSKIFEVYKSYPITIVTNPPQSASSITYNKGSEALCTWYTL
jgi:biopolymer transport protein ExbD